ncbi:MAG: hypothetical protein ACJATF_003232 [Flavobacteriales bacterium]
MSPHFLRVCDAMYVNSGRRSQRNQQLEMDAAPVFLYDGTRLFRKLVGV